MFSCRFSVNTVGTTHYFMKNTFTHYQEEIIKNYYPIGGSEKCLPFIPNKTLLQIAKKASHMGIRVTPEARAQISHEHNYKSKRKEYEENFKQNCNLTDEKFIYLLGLLWADGHLSSQDGFRTGLNIVESDYLNIKDIFWKGWTFYKRKKLEKHPSWKTVVSIRLSNKFLFEFLEENDYKIKSGASPNKILSKIPERLKHYWWRGYLDGDGCIFMGKFKGSYRIDFSSVYEQDWSFIKAIENKLNITFKIKRHIYKGNKSSNIYIQKYNQVINLGNYIYNNYENDKIGFLRKYEKFQDILNYNHLNFINYSDKL